MKNSDVPLSHKPTVSNEISSLGHMSSLNHPRHTKGKPNENNTKKQQAAGFPISPTKKLHHPTSIQTILQFSPTGAVCFQLNWHTASSLSDCPETSEACWHCTTKKSLPAKHLIDRHMCHVQESYVCSSSFNLLFESPALGDLCYCI